MFPTTRTTCLSSYPVEFELDSQGQRIPDPLFRWKITPQSMENRQKKREARCKGAEPLETLTPFQKYYPGVPNHQPPKMFFGLALQWQHFSDYAKRQGITFENETAPAAHCLQYAVQVSIRRLENLARATLHIEIPRVPDADVMIALYSNYTWWTDELEDEDQAEVIEILQKELGITSKPMWYWDAKTT